MRGEGQAVGKWNGKWLWEKRWGLVIVIRGGGGRGKARRGLAAARLKAGDSDAAFWAQKSGHVSAQAAWNGGEATGA